MAQKAPLQIAGVIYDVFVKKKFVKKKKRLLKSFSFIFFLPTAI